MIGAGAAVRLAVVQRNIRHGNAVAHHLLGLGGQRREAEHECGREHR